MKGSWLACILALLGGASSTDAQTQPLSIGEIDERMRQNESALGSLAGDEKVVLTPKGKALPDLPANVIEDDRLEGDYRWFVHGSHWWMVKRKSDPNPTEDGAVILNVVRDHEDQVLRYVESLDQEGRVGFLTGHLDRTQYQGSVGPFAGRRWNKGAISGYLRAMKNVRQSSSPDGIEIDGLYEGLPLHLTVAPQYGYLTTKLLLHPADFEYGFTITDVHRSGSSYLPRTMDLVSLVRGPGGATTGYRGRVEFSNFEPHGAPTRQEVGAPSPGAIIGSEENRLYRFDPDGSLVDFGRQGYKPGTPHAWGDLFVLSGAGLLLGSLSWLVFRKRRSSPSSSRR